jgi:hypothetical protein
LTGGSSIALHSWDDSFVRNTVRRQVGRNLRLIETGDVSAHQADTREVVALRALRNYDQRVKAGIDLFVYNNNNRGQVLDIHSLEQSLAEWLRKTLRESERRTGFGSLVCAHATKGASGLTNLARNAFRAPPRIVARGASFLTTLVSSAAPDPGEIAGLTALLYSYVTEVLQMNEKNLAEIRSTACKLGGLLYRESSPGKLRKLRAQLKEPQQLRMWLTAECLEWAIAPPPTGGRGTQSEAGSLDVTTPPSDEPRGPLVSERAFTLLFEPGSDNPSWFHRDLLLIGVLEELARLNWKPTTPDEDDEEIAQLPVVDKKFFDEEYEQ